MIVVQIIIVFVTVVILYAAYYLGKSNPETITSFKKGVSSDEIEKDKR